MVKLDLREQKDKTFKSYKGQEEVAGHDRPRTEMSQQIKEERHLSSG